MQVTRTSTLTLALATLALTGCSWVAIATAPTKVASAPSEQAQVQARAFWEALHAGQYERIDTLLESHMQVVLADPSDPLTMSHAGWLHAWKFSERNRLPPQARIVEHATAARRLFDEAVLLAPDEARYRGFAAGFTMAEAGILKNEKQARQGYYDMKHAVAMWPEFNLFTSGYVMSINPPDSAPFKEGLAQQWETLDACFGEKVSRNSPALGRYMALETTEGPKRVCWNSWIAPHNWEGFFLNFGDMLARAGDLPNAQTMYEATRLSKTYGQWPYRDVLERRLARLDALPDQLNAAQPQEAEFASMINTRFSCMACHQEKADPPLFSRMSHPGTRGD
jgi:hypothetical protein